MLRTYKFGPTGIKDLIPPQGKLLLLLLLLLHTHTHTHTHTEAIFSVRKKMEKLIVASRDGWPHLSHGRSI